MALTHVTHRTGLVMPVEAIAKAAREHAIDVILDGAHALGQIEFNLAELGIAFAGFNLHKWIGAPLTLGFLYIAPNAWQILIRTWASSTTPPPTCVPVRRTARRISPR